VWGVLAATNWCEFHVNIINSTNVINEKLFKSSKTTFVEETFAFLHVDDVERVRLIGPGVGDAEIEPLLPPSGVDIGVQYKIVLPRTYLSSSENN
jgi:hypothetical protein